MFTIGTLMGLIPAVGCWIVGFHMGKIVGYDLHIKHVDEFENFVWKTINKDG